MAVGAFLNADRTPVANSGGGSVPVDSAVNALMQVNQDIKRHAWWKILHWVGSPVLGVVILATIVVYLSLASTVPSFLAGLVGGSLADIYRHPLLAVLGGTICFSILAAGWTRLILEWPHAGAWCSHLGVLVLAGGIFLYVGWSVSGACVTAKRGPGDWTEITGFYANRSHAARISTPAAGQAIQTILLSGHLDQLDNKPVELNSPDSGIRARSMGFRKWAKLTHFLGLLVTEAGKSRTLRLRFGGADQADGYQLTFDPQATPEMLERLSVQRGPQAELGLGQFTVVVLTGPEVAPTVAVARPDGTICQTDFDKSGIASVGIADRELTLELLGSGLDLAESPQDLPCFAGPALLVELSANRRALRTWVPFAAYPEMSASLKVDLPAGQVATLGYSLAEHPLPIKIERLEPIYLTHPGSVMPRDYICKLELSDGARETISLNDPLQVGQYQISQGSWLPSGSDPQRIVLTVTTRPGLPLIWIGSCLIAIGLPYSFYIKPLLLKRRKGNNA